MYELFVDKEKVNTKILDTKNPIRALRVLVTLFLTIPTMMFTCTPGPHCTWCLHIMKGLFMIIKSSINFILVING